MIPYIKTGWGNIPTFTLCVACGVVSFLIMVHVKLKKYDFKDVEETFIFPKIVFSGMVGFFSAAFFDALFKVRENNGFIISGITFYGGLIGAVLSLYILLKCSNNKSHFNTNEWFDLLTIPLIFFHILGRVGCFFGGCCYGKETSSCLGMFFPDRPEYNIYHKGMKCYPTQLFEIIALIIILLIVLNVKKRMKTYFWSYAIARFIIEFFRGDDRGYILSWVSPAQMISIIIVMGIIILSLIQRRNMKKN